MEIVSGKSLLEIEREKLLDPLGMTDTNFFVTEPERLKRLAQPVPNDSNFRVGREYRTEVRQKWESASGGMVTTMSDFSRFAQMLLNGGTFEGKTYLSPKTARAPVSSGIISISPATGLAWGLGLPCAPFPAMPSRRRRDRWANSNGTAPAVAIW
jgi:CubicO group peptidase (beta-lactamase class C family)